MSVHSEDLLVHEIEQEQKDEKNCVVSNKGVTLFGYTVSWLVIVLVLVGVFVYLNKKNMLGQSVSNVVSQSMTGGFMEVPKLEKISLNLPKPGQIRKLYGDF